MRNFDVRARQFNQAKLWSSPEMFGPRAFFRAATDPAALVIDNIKLADEGVYRCRVDFKNSPTRNSKVNFTVIELQHRVTSQSALTFFGPSLVQKFSSVPLTSQISKIGP
ncbi:unnamed protein product [Diabrotica balteata]|uniref:Ig-like domain-containing protein n=1 Tax=Diabrotica balteata TaxID=107213 RepID=A0A9N9T6Q6_DIABA|nr:unnamed protein product [Diabrotica balteata]